MSLGNVLGTIAPMAAGFFGGPALAGLMGTGATAGSIAAGALTGGGIAALTGDDILTGAVSGGLGGYGGGGFRGAADATKLASGTTNASANAAAVNASNAATQVPLTNTMASQAGKFNPALTGQAGLPSLTAGGASPYAGATSMMQQTGQLAQGPLTGAPIAGGGGYNPSAFGRAGDSISGGLDSASAAFDDTDSFFTNLGEGNVNKGYMKAGLTALPVGVAALTPEIQPYEKDPDEMYDPNRRLNLNMDTGIDEALRKDSGLRLYAEGGDVGGGVTGAGLAPGTPVAGATSEGIAGATSEGIAGAMPSHPMLGSFDHMVSMGVHPANAAAEVGLDPTPFLMLGPTRDVPKPYGGRERKMAFGGYLNGGGVAGDGMSDDVPAMIDGSQKAALSQGEFVLPADVVSHLGNGSSDAGSKRLYGMMDKVRKARTGNEKQGKQINPERFMPS